MTSSLHTLTARRAWFVPNFMVWGIAAPGELEYLAVENVNGTLSIYFGMSSLDDGPQTVSYADLVDHRGNSLPAIIKSPRIFPRAKSTDTVFVVGSESNSCFQIARDPETTGPVTTDLLIVEMGD
jgi:hypothetical protein